MSCKSVPEECPTRGSYKNLRQECPTRVSYKSDPHVQECNSVRPECLTRVSYKKVLQERPTRVSCKSVPEECPKRVLQEFPTRVSHTSVLQEWSRKESHKGVLQECPTRVSDQCLRSRTDTMHPALASGRWAWGNQRRMLQVPQFGPPPTNNSSPATAREHRLFQSGAWSISWPRGPLSLRMSIAQTSGERSGQIAWRSESNEPASSLPAWRKNG